MQAMYCGREDGTREFRRQVSRRAGGTRPRCGQGIRPGREITRGTPGAGATGSGPGTTGYSRLPRIDREIRCPGGRPSPAGGCEAGLARSPARTGQLAAWRAGEGRQLPRPPPGRAGVAGRRGAVVRP